MARTIDIAQDIVDRAINKRYEPTTLEISADYGVVDGALAQVKKHAKRIAGERGVVWGYHPRHNRYIVAPTHRCTEQREVIEYALEQASRAANSIRFQVVGAEISGNVKRESSVKVQRQLKGAAKTIKHSADRLEWVSANV